MIRTEWTVGEHHALVREGLVLLLAQQVSRADVVRLWTRIDESDEAVGLGGLLDVLRESTGAALSSLPDFAMAVVDAEGLHVAARGQCLVRVGTVTGEDVELRGADVSTWVERNFATDAAASVVLGSSGSGDWLPLAGGVVPAGAVHLALSADVVRHRPGVAVDAPSSDVEPPVAVEPVVTAPRSSVETLAEAESVEPDPAPAEEPAVEPVVAAPAGRFADLFSPHTVLHDIEDAAVRAVDPDEHGDPGGSRPAAETREEPVLPEPEAAPAVVAPVDVPLPPAPAPLPTPSSFISGVPTSAAAPPTPTPTLAPTPAPSPSDDDGPEHHDGHTLMEAPDSTEIDAYLSSADGSGSDAMVLGVWCSAGHANPTHRTECRVCGGRLAGDGVRMPRPSLGWLHTSAGESIELAQNVLAGRNPRASQIQGPVLPRLLPLPHSHVSGTHLEIRLEGWSVMVVDLDSTNGTFLQRPGQPTVRISRSPQLLTSQDVVQLGHGVDLRFEALP